MSATTTFVIQPATTFAEIMANLAAIDPGLAVAWLIEHPQPTAEIGRIFRSALPPADQDAINVAWSAAAVAKAKSENGAALRLAVSKRGGISLYGVNVKMPVTLYAGQWLRVADYFGIPADSVLRKFIASNPVETFPESKYESADDKAYLAEVKAGKHPHAKYADGKVTTGLALRTAA